jgi:hypothetical protein
LSPAFAAYLIALLLALMFFLLALALDRSE